MSKVLSKLSPGDIGPESIDALNNFRKNSHNLIILDLKMPNMDGISLYQKIVAIDDKIIIVLLLLIKD